MKNLFLPFVVVALFAVGSCGDEASVNAPVKKVTKPIVIKSLKSVRIDSLAVRMNYNNNTTNQFFSRIGFPGAHYEGLNFIQTDTLNYFTCKVYEIYNKGYASRPFNSHISFRIDSVNQELKDILFSQGRSYNHYNSHGIPTEADHTNFDIYISKAAYSINDTLLTVRLSGESLQDKITNLYYTSSGHQGGTTWYYSIASMLPFDNSSVFELQFIIE